MLEQEAARLRAVREHQPLVDDLAAAFAEAGHRLWLVGGAVRDALLRGADQVDLDFTTDARPAASERVLRGWADAVWLTGAAFGTVSAEKRGWDGVAHVIEVTTFRTDAYTPGSRHPEVVYGDTVEQDLSRRDFTVNALALDLDEPLATAERGLVDPFGGLVDLRARVLRTPVDARQSFDDDPLRMLRLARFAAKLGFDVEEQTLAAASAMAPDLATISAERVRAEMVKLLGAAEAATGVDVLATTRLLDHAPGLDGLGGQPLRRARARLQRWSRRHQPVPAMPWTRLAPSPTDHPAADRDLVGYGGPAHPGATLEAVVGIVLLTLDLPAGELPGRLRALTCSTDVVRGVAAVRDAIDGGVGVGPEASDPASVRRAVHQLGPWHGAWLAAVACRGDDGDAELVVGHRAVEAALWRSGDLPDLSVPVDGRDLMAALDLPPGPRLGRLLAAVTDRRLADGPLDRAAALAVARAALADER